MIVSDSHYYLKQYLHGYVSSLKAMSLSQIRSDLFHVYCLKAPLGQRTKRPGWFRLEPQRGLGKLQKLLGLTNPRDETTRYLQPNVR